MNFVFISFCLLIAWERVAVSVLLLRPSDQQNQQGDYHLPQISDVLLHLSKFQHGKLITLNPSSKLVFFVSLATNGLRDFLLDNRASFQRSTWLLALARNENSQIWKCSDFDLFSGLHKCLHGHMVYSQAIRDKIHWRPELEHSVLAIQWPWFPRVLAINWTRLVYFYNSISEWATQPSLALFILQERSFSQTVEMTLQFDLFVFVESN